MDRFDAMRVFLAVAESGGFSAAARRLAMPLATVSRKLAALEQALETRLVTRTTRRMALTEAGLRYLDVCRRVLAELDEVERSLAGEQGEPRGLLAVTAPVVFGRLHVLPVVLEFLRAHPRVDIRMLLVDRVVDLIEEGLDVAVRIGELPDSALIATRVGSMGRIVCASPAYLAARGRPRLPADLADHDCISFSAAVQVETWTFSEKRGEQRVPVRSRLTVNTAEAAVDAAVAGLGLTRVLAYQAAHALAESALERVLIEHEPPAAPVHLVHRESHFPPARVRGFLAFAAERLRPRLAALAS